MIKRCDWCGTEPIYVDYHDKEWGVPVHDDRMHFEMIILDGAQAGLSWITILKRRESYREAFDNFDVLKVSRYSDKKMEKLLTDPGIKRSLVLLINTYGSSSIIELYRINGKR